MILKNEEEFLPACLESIVDHVNEVVLADTGSTDRTLEIAESFRARVPQFKILHLHWRDDFSWARNEVAKSATQPWIFALDGDEVVDPDSLQHLKAATEQNRVACFAVVQMNYTRDPQTEGAELCEKAPPGFTTSEPLYHFDNWMDRLYRREAEVEFEGQIHESLIPALRRKGFAHQNLPIILHHFGRLKRGLDLKAKANYYFSLTQKKLQSQSNNPAVWIEMLMTLMELERFEEAYRTAELSMKKFPTEPEVLRYAFQAALRFEQFSQAEDWIRKYSAIRPDDAYADTQLSTALLYQKKFSEVLSVTQKNLKRDPEDFISLINAAVVHFENQSWADADQLLKRAQKIRPGDPFIESALKRIPRNASF